MENYKKLLEKAQKAYKNCVTGAEKRRLESIFPELKENEGEMIREEIVDYLKGFIPHTDLDLVRKSKVWIEWLEKQGEQKPVEHFELKAGHWYFCHQAYCCRADDLTVKEGERFMCEEDGVVKGFIIKYPEKYFIEIDAPESHDKKPNPTWSEEDEVGFGDAMWAIEQARSIAKDENDMGNLWYAEKWIKSLKDRLKGE